MVAKADEGMDLVIANAVVRARMVRTGMTDGLDPLLGATLALNL